MILGGDSRVKFQGLKSLRFSLVTVSPYSQKIKKYFFPPHSQMGSNFPLGCGATPFLIFPISLYC